MQPPYISELFNAISSTPIHTKFNTKISSNIYTIHDSMLFVMNKQGFGDKTSAAAGHAKISKLNIFTGVEETYFVPPSPTFIKIGGKTNHLWTWALAASDSLLFLATDEGIWIYQLTDANQYQYLKAISLKLVSKLQIVNNDLHAFVKHDDGFNWLKINLSNYKIENVRLLSLTNRFFLQIAPDHMITMNNNALYLLQRNVPTIEKYSLTGKLLANYSLEILDWEKIPEETTRQLDAIKDITERVYAFSKFSIHESNYMYLFYVFPCERFLMVANDNNKTANTFMTPYFIQIIGDTTIIESYSTNLYENEKFGEKLFPFLIANAEGNLIFAQLNEYIAQINRGTTVSWQNKTQKEFQHEENLYHRDHDPVEKMETYRFIKNYIPVDSIQFLNYDDQIFSLNDVKKEKAIFIVSQHPQCLACVKSLWRHFSHTVSPDVELYNVAPNCPTYLAKKENIKEVSAFLKTEYTPLFMDTKQLTPATKRLLAQKASPVVLLFDKKLQHVELFSSMYMIADPMGNLSPSFIQTIKNFMEH